MATKKPQVISNKKFQKEFNRKNKVKEGGIKNQKKQKMSQKQIDKIMEGMQKAEGERREAVQDFLIRKGFKLMDDKWKASFEYQKEKYQLSKINLDDDMKKQLWEEVWKFVWLYQIADVETYKKVLVFQVQVIQEEGQDDIYEYRVITITSTLEANK